MSERESLEASVRACYETWSARYYEDYYRGAGAYPPVHTDIVRRLLRETGTRTLLDAGCGPASMLRDLGDLGLERWGFDLTPGMVSEARRVLAQQGMHADRLWEGSVLDPAAFKAPSGGPEGGYDAAICFGVLPHIPENADGVVLANLCRSVRPGGLVAIEARNQLFALFTLNRYSRDFFHEALIDVKSLRAEATVPGEAAGLDRALAMLDRQFRIDLPPIRRGKAGEPGYDEVLSRTHNPMLLRQQAEAAGMTGIKILFYHFHALPPMAESEIPGLFRRASVAMEKSEDWRGYFMASAFVLVGRRAG